MPTMKVKLPSVIEVDDYHEFEDIARYYRALNKSIKVHEVGFAGDYLGIAYVGSLNKGANKKLVAELKEEVKEFERI